MYATSDIELMEFVRRSLVLSIGFLQDSTERKRYFQADKNMANRKNIFFLEVLSVVVGNNFTVILCSYDAHAGAQKSG